jgi:hypothetical protein
MYICACLPIWLRSGCAAMDMSKVAIIGGFHSLFLVFFASQSYGRYIEFSNYNYNMQGRLFDIVGLAASGFEQSELGRAAAHRLMRHVNAIHALAYIGITPTYTCKNFLEPLNKVHQIFSPKEWERIEEIKGIGTIEGGSAYREVMGWALTDVEEMLKAGKVDPHLAAQLRAHICNLRGNAAGLSIPMDLPMPFFYVHLVTIISGTLRQFCAMPSVETDQHSRMIVCDPATNPGIYLPLFAYGVAVDVDVSSSPGLRDMMVSLAAGFISSAMVSSNSYLKAPSDIFPVAVLSSC